MQQKNMRGPSRTSTKKTPRHAMRSTVSAALSRLYSFALIGLLVLSAASCRTKRTVTQTRQTELTEQGESHGSSASHDTTLTRNQTDVSRTATQEWEQTWLVLPLDSGGYRIVGKGTKSEKGTLRSESRDSSTSSKTDSSTVRTTLEKRSDGVLRTLERKSPEYFSSGTLLWVIVLTTLFSIGYIIVVKHQKRQKQWEK